MVVSFTHQIETASALIAANCSRIINEKSVVSRSESIENFSYGKYGCEWNGGTIWLPRLISERLDECIPGGEAAWLFTPGYE